MLALLCFGSHAAAQSLAHVQSWPVLYQERTDAMPKPQTFSAQESALLGQIVRAANAHPALRAYRRTLPAWAQRDLSLDGVVFSAVAPYRSAKVERLTIIKFAEHWNVRLVVLSGGATSSAWLLVDGASCIMDEFTLRDTDLDRLKELVWVHGCADSGSQYQIVSIFSLMKWQAGELKLTYEAPLRAAGLGTEKTATLHIKGGREPQIASVVTTTESVWNASQGKFQVVRTQVSLGKIEDVESGTEALKIMRLW